MRWRSFGTSVLLVCCLGVACGRERTDEYARAVAESQPTASTRAVGALPATYTGVLPCADCPGIRYRLAVRPDSVYFLRTTYLVGDGSEGESFDDIGVWGVSSDGMTLVLRGGREAPSMFAVRGADTLRKLDTAGKEIESQLNYDLARTKRFEPFEPRMSLRGTFSYMADAGLFRECITTKRFPVAQEGDRRSSWSRSS